MKIRSALLASALALAVAGTAAGQPSIDSGPGQYTNDDTPSFSWSGGGAGTGDFRWGLSTGPFTDSTDTATTLGGLGDGTYTFQVWQFDGTDFTLGPAERAFTVDTADPDVTLTRSPASPNGSNGWYRSAVTVTFACDDLGGSPLQDPGGWPAQVIVDQQGEDIPVAKTCLDAAGNDDAASTSIDLDSVDPGISRSVSPASPTGSNGWYTGTVTVDTTCSDATSGVDSCPADVTVTTDTSPSGRVIEGGSAVDEAGNASAPIGATTIFRDATDPTVSIESPRGATAPATPPASGPVPYELGIDPTPVADYSCGDATSGVASCTGTRLSGQPVEGYVVGQVSSLGVRAFTVTGTDVAGNSRTVTRNYRVVDTTPPTTPVTGQPGEITNDTTPVFTWLPSTDAGVGVARYDVTVNATKFEVPVASCTGPECTFELPAAAALAPGLHTWRVAAVDAAGRTSPSSVVASFQVDPNAPPAPTIVGGPRGFTTNSTPTFAFTGLLGAQFTWKVERASNNQVVQGPATTAAGQVTLAALADGQYRFEVSQRGANGAQSGTSAALFTVDTVRPAVPSITSSPGTTGDGQPSFSWSGGEPGATFRWVVQGSGGNVVMGPGSVNSPSVKLPAPLPGGSYVFLVRQVDQAGNEGDWSAPEPFTIIGPPSATIPTTPPSGTPTSNTPTVRRVVPKPVPKVANSSRLTPRRGITLRSARPVLRWKRAPRATLYNVQIFRLVGSRYVKVLSAFPAGLRYRVPANRLRSGNRYVWRVWPYLGGVRRYTKAPLGSSWFDYRAPVKRSTPRARR